ncbi:hypothetical protein [Mycobacterium sp. PSTR-4-N]|uniref:hypothetical protein n=1 Tax=Mycobacterium sp. PSTR-4-N TaxID=2917745 RepID=UPI001F14D75F|nr:hypothetical protein [Mycobacterium sp. PSTR-4-N]MCG7592388.1 hypothetical protein [Mycobacterium sp. PSTR-4-N]
MQHDIPSPNPFLTSWLLSGDCARVMREAGGHARDLYRSIVAKDSGALAASARIDLAIGGLKHDRIVADMSVGRGLPRGGYGAAHEFGTKRTVEGPAQPGADGPVRTGGHHAADDLVKVLAIMSSMS